METSRNTESLWSARRRRRELKSSRGQNHANPEISRALQKTRIELKFQNQKQKASNHSNGQNQFCLRPFQVCGNSFHWQEKPCLTSDPARTKLAIPSTGCQGPFVLFEDGNIEELFFTSLDDWRKWNSWWKPVIIYLRQKIVVGVAALISSKCFFCELKSRKKERRVRALKRDSASVSFWTRMRTRWSSQESGRWTSGQRGKKKNCRSFQTGRFPHVKLSSLLPNNSEEYKVDWVGERNLKPSIHMWHKWLQALYKRQRRWMFISV